MTHIPGRRFCGFIANLIRGNICCQDNDWCFFIPSLDQIAVALRPTAESRSCLAGSVAHEQLGDVLLMNDTTTICLRYDVDPLRVESAAVLGLIRRDR